jgi:hypothetical protein
MDLWKFVAAGLILLAGGCSREAPQDKGVTIMLDDPVPAPRAVEAARLAAADAPAAAESGPAVSASPGFSPEIWDSARMVQEDSRSVANP